MNDEAECDKIVKNLKIKSMSNPAGKALSGYS